MFSSRIAIVFIAESSKYFTVGFWSNYDLDTGVLENKLFLTVGGNFVHVVSGVIVARDECAENYFPAEST